MNQSESIWHIYCVFRFISYDVDFRLPRNVKTNGITVLMVKMNRKKRRKSYKLKYLFRFGTIPSFVVCIAVPILILTIAVVVPSVVTRIQAYLQTRKVQPEPDAPAWVPRRNQ
ncbi:hypothetical protein BVY04_01715 [bacterium M21]|nr:hypothetical protein BVY04_01715 [bacterium M21]